MDQPDRAPSMIERLQVSDPDIAEAFSQLLKRYTEACAEVDLLRDLRIKEGKLIEHHCFIGPANMAEIGRLRAALLGIMEHAQLCCPDTVTLAAAALATGKANNV